MKTLTLEADVQRLGEVTEFIDALLEARDCPMKAQMQIELAIDEIFTNIASYAYASGRGDAIVGFDFDEATRTVTLTFTDSGMPYDPLKKPDPDVTLSAEEREIGGLGIFLVKKNMDEMRYERVDGQNVLTMKKRI